MYWFGHKYILAGRRVCKHRASSREGQPGLSERVGTLWLLDVGCGGRGVLLGLISLAEARLDTENVIFLFSERMFLHLDDLQSQVFTLRSSV